MKKISIIFSIILLFFIIYLFFFVGTKGIFSFLIALLFSMIVCEMIFQWDLDKEIEKILNKTQQLSINDVINKKEYYRNIINDYSISELYYVDKMECDIKFSVALILLMLINKKIIKIENDNIVILNTNNDNLKKSELCIKNNIKNGKINIYNLYDVDNIIDLSNKQSIMDLYNNKFDLSKIRSINKVIEDECIEDDLIHNEKNKTRSILLITVIITSLLCVVWLLILSFFFQNIDGTVIMIPVVIILMNVLFFKHIISLEKTLYKRTFKGNKINNYLNGLKHFIKDFSNIDDERIQSIKLWDDYLIYSVMFKNNIKVLDEINKVIIDYKE